MVVLLVVACLGRRPAGVLLAGILAALLAPFQFFAFPATYLIVGLYVVTTGAWRQRTVLRDAVLFLAPVILAAPFIVGAIVQQSDIGSFKFVLGWATAPLDDGPAAVAFFYLTNLGIPFVLAVIAAFTARGMPYRWFLAAWVLALFIVPNVVEVSAVDIRHEQVLPDHVDRGRDPGRLAAPSLAAEGRSSLLVFVSMFSTVLIADWHMRSRDVALSLPQEAAARWIAANTPERSVFITDAFINSPVDLAGRLRITTFGAVRLEPRLRPGAARGRHEGHLLRRARRRGRADGDVRRDVRALERRRSRATTPPATDFASSDRFETVYDEDGVTIWRLAGT